MNWFLTEKTLPPATDDSDAYVLISVDGQTVERGCYRTDENIRRSSRWSVIDEYDGLWVDLDHAPKWWTHWPIAPELLS